MKSAEVLFAEAVFFPKKIIICLDK